MAKKSAGNQKPSTGVGSNKPDKAIKSKVPKGQLPKSKARKSKARKTKARKSKARKTNATKSQGKSKSAEVLYELVYVAESPLHGKGMFAVKKIKANITLGKLEGYPTKKDGTYVLWQSEKKALRVTNDFRFINHSGTPNCALTDTEVVTLKSIKPDEELTHDYGW